MKSYSISDGLQEILSSALETHLMGHTAAWIQEVNDTEIGEEALAVFVAVGWIPSKRDSRLTLVEPDAVGPATDL
jgi:hypothetical protein